MMGFHEQDMSFYPQTDWLIIISHVFFYPNWQLGYFLAIIDKQKPKNLQLPTISWPGVQPRQQPDFDAGALVMDRCMAVLIWFD